MRWPLTWTAPRLGGSRPPISLRSVDLPAPDRPDTKINSPALMRKLISARMLRPRPYDLKTCWNSIMAQWAVAGLRGMRHADWIFGDGKAGVACHRLYAETATTSATVWRRNLL